MIQIETTSIKKKGKGKLEIENYEFYIVHNKIWQ